MALYRGYFVPSEMDPTGRLSIAQEGAEIRQRALDNAALCRNKKPSPCEDFRKNWRTKYPKFAGLFDCAVKNGCVNRNRLLCRKCERGLDGKYSDGGLFFPNYILICESAFGPSKNTKKILLEEVYHALTLCYGGKPQGDCLVEFESPMLSDSGLGDKMKECARCVARELLALKCASPNLSFNMQLNLAMGSCDNCDPTYTGSSHEVYVKTELGNILKKWFESGCLGADCRDIDKACGVN